MIVLGLTGGVGMGKSVAAGLLSDQGLPVIDTDQLARDLVVPGQPALREIVEYFGGDVLDSTGCLRRDVLAQKVFADESQRRHLEGILHPRIRQSWLEQVESWRQSRHPLAVVVIPLLFETQAAEEFDRIVCVGCSGPTQRQRLAARGWSSTEAERRLAAQWPIDRKIALAHFVVWTEASLDIHAEQWRRILGTLRIQNEGS